MHPVCIKPRRGLSCAVFDGVVRRSNNARNDAVRRSPLQYALRSFLRIIRLHATSAERISQLYMGEVTSQSLCSQCYRHFVGITPCYTHKMAIALWP